MKIRSFYGLFLAFLALVLLFSGCDVLSLGKDGDKPTDPPAATNNGNLFGNKKTTDNNIVFLSIYSSSSANTSVSAARLITPKSGDNYALAVITPDKNGNWSWSSTDTPDSVGTISIADDTITFKPTTPAGQGSFNGSITGNVLTLDNVPGHNYPNLKLDFLRETRITANNLFGDNMNFPTEGGNTNTGGDDNTSGTTFNAGRYITNVKFSTMPTFGKVFEGQEVKLTSGMISITYSDGTTSPVSVNGISYYIIEPPFYFEPGGTHYFIYNGEYNTNTSGIPFTVPTVNTSPTATTGFYYLVANPVISGTENITYYEGFGFDFGNLRIYGTHITSYSGNTGITSGSELYRYAIPPTVSGTTNATLNFGGTSNTASTSVSITYYPLLDIKILNPAFKNQITFDDPRFFTGSSTTATWYSHLSDTEIALGYGDTQKKIKFINAAMRINGDAKSTLNTQLTLNPPGSWSTSSNTLSIEYGQNGSAKTSLPVDIPLYDTLAKVDVKSKDGSTIVLKGANGDNEDSFLNKVNVYAIYQMGSNKNNQVSKPVFHGAYFSELNSFINATFSTNVSRDGILTTPNSNSYDKNQKLQKATVTITSWPGNDNNPTSGTYSASGSIQVGVTGY